MKKISFVLSVAMCLSLAACTKMCGEKTESAPAAEAPAEPAASEQAEAPAEPSADTAAPTEESPSADAGTAEAPAAEGA